MRKLTLTYVEPPLQGRPTRPLELSGFVYRPRGDE
jgi:hypothetical protein